MRGQFVCLGIEGGLAEVGNGMGRDHKLVGRRSPGARHGPRGRDKGRRHNSNGGNARVF